MIPCKVNTKFKHIFSIKNIRKVYRSAIRQWHDISQKAERSAALKGGKNTSMNKPILENMTDEGNVDFF